MVNTTKIRAEAITSMPPIIRDLCDEVDKLREELQSDRAYCRDRALRALQGKVTIKRMLEALSDRCPICGSVGYRNHTPSCFVGEFML